MNNDPGVILFRRFVDAGVDRFTAGRAVQHIAESKGPHELAHAVFRWRDYTAADLLECGFVWHGTPHGYIFWSTLCDTLRRLH